MFWYWKIIKMTKSELIERLKVVRDLIRNSPGQCHEKADSLLLDYIDDPEVEQVYDDIDKHYNY